MTQEPNEDELTALERQHLPYELAMLQAAANVLAKGRPEKGDHPAQSLYFMAIESFYIHVRNLYAFFFEARAKRGERDAVASQLLGGDKGWRKRYGIKDSRSLREAADTADKLVAHLGYTRIEILEAGRGLDWASLLEEIKSAHDAFQEERVRQQKTPVSFRELHTEKGLKYGSATTVSTWASATVEFYGWLDSMTRKDGPDSEQ